MQRTRMSAKASELGDRIRTRRDAAKMDDLDRDNERLRYELKMLRSELDRDRNEREELLGALASTRVTKVVKKRRGLIRTLIVGSVAYVVGARAGRDRYDEIMTRLRSLRDRGKARLEQAADDTADDLLVVEDRPTAPATPGMSREMGLSGQSPAKPASSPITPRDREHHAPA